MQQLSLQQPADRDSCSLPKSRSLTFASQCCFGSKLLPIRDLTSLSEFLAFCRSHGNYWDYADHSLWPKVSIKGQYHTFELWKAEAKSKMFQNSGSPTRTRQGTAGRTMLTSTAARRLRFKMPREPQRNNDIHTGRGVWALPVLCQELPDNLPQCLGWEVEWTEGEGWAATHL